MSVRKYSFSVEGSFDCYDKDLNSTIETKLELLVSNLHYNPINKKLNGDLVFQILVHDTITDSYRPIFKKTIKGGFNYDISISELESDEKLGKLERIIRNTQILEDGLEGYEYLLEFGDSEYNEIDVDNEDSILYKFRHDRGYLPKVRPLNFLELLKDLYSVFVYSKNCDENC